MNLALFDLDNTLLSGDSDFEWAQFLIGKGVLDREVYEACNNEFYEHYKAGTLRLLAQSTTTRSPSLPDVPTYQEAGIKGLTLDQWLGVFVPAGTPPTIGARLNAEIGKALADPAIRDSFLQSAQEPIGGSAEQFSRLFREDFEKYERLVKDLSIKSN